MIKLTNIKKSYKKDGICTDAIKDISLDIHDNEMVALMGRSGAGKSTLLNILGGLDKPDSGEYRFNDQIVSNLSVDDLNIFRKDHISIVFQQFMLLNDYSIYENIELPLKLKNYDKRKRRELIDKILKELDMYDIKRKRPKNISGGQKQRVAIARAMVSDSDIILADEPTGSIDTENAKNVMEMFKKINLSGKTVIIVTHDERVAEYCDRLITIEDGLVIDDKKIRD